MRTRTAFRQPPTSQPTVYALSPFFSRHRRSRAPPSVCRRPYHDSASRPRTNAPPRGPNQSADVTSPSSRSAPSGRSARYTPAITSVPPSSSKTLGVSSRMTIASAVVPSGSSRIAIETTWAGTAYIFNAPAKAATLGAGVPPECCGTEDVSLAVPQLSTPSAGRS